MTFRYFPFDLQMCSLKFSSWIYDKRLLVFELEKPKTDLTEYNHNEAWALQDTLLLSKDHEYPNLGFTFQELYRITLLMAKAFKN